MYEEILQKWRDISPERIEDMDTAMENFRILFAYNSNAIENPMTTYHDTREIFENGKVVGYTGNLRTLYEIQNQKNCYEMLKERIISKEPLSPVLIKDIHNSLLAGCYDEDRWEKGERPGEFKKGDYVTGDNIGSAAEEVEEEMEELCREVNEAKGDPLKIAAYLHLRFETIHPFADGNGRVGRTLINYYLMTQGHPPLVLYEEDKKTYYMALAVYDNTEDIEGMTTFLKEQLIKTWTPSAKPEKKLKDHI